MPKSCPNFWGLEGNQRQRSESIGTTELLGIIDVYRQAHVIPRDSFLSGELSISSAVRLTGDAVFDHGHVGDGEAQRKLILAGAMIKPAEWARVLHRVAVVETP
jgi:hypothetical protein